MKCPKCKSTAPVLESRTLIDNIEKRVRKCNACNHLFDTYEFNADDIQDLLEEREAEMKYAAKSLCWRCKRATGFCSWSREFEPVKGWTAEKTITGTMESYEVKQCPLFEKNKRSMRKNG